MASAGDGAGSGTMASTSPVGVDGARPGSPIGVVVPSLTGSSTSTGGTSALRHRLLEVRGGGKTPKISKFPGWALRNPPFAYFSISKNSWVNYPKKCFL